MKKIYTHIIGSLTINFSTVLTALGILMPFTDALRHNFSSVFVIP